MYTVETGLRIETMYTAQSPYFVDTMDQREVGHSKSTNVVTEKLESENEADFPTREFAESIHKV